MMRILITGATSFTGQAAAKAFLEDPETEVFGTFRPDSRKKDRLPVCPRFHAVPASLEELSDGTVTDLVRPDVILHLAWAGTAKHERMDPEVQERNVSLTASLLRHAASCGCRRFLFAGSQAEYGVTLERLERDGAPALPYGEETECRPVSEYGRAKRRVLSEGAAVSRESGMVYIHLRIFSLYGRGEPDTTLVQTAVRAAAAGARAEFGPCRQPWNFLAVSDCAEAIRLLALTDRAGIPEKDSDAAVNIGSTDTRILREFAEEIFSAAGRGSVSFSERPPGPEGTPALAPDISRLESLTGFRPRKTFREGILELLAT